jgi:ribosomal-protein-alanine N-acetyltransferase
MLVPLARRMEKGPSQPPSSAQVMTTSGESMGSVLETPRLSMRRLAPGDSAFLVELMNEPPYIDNIGDRGVRTVADAMRYIEEKYTASYVRHGFGLYLVGLKAGAAPMGICGLVRRESLDHPDLGFAFLRRFWSMGYATEAAGATLGHARETLKLSYVYGVVSPKNARSIRLLEHLGFHYVRSLELPGQASESHLYGTELRPPRQLPNPAPGTDASRAGHEPRLS